MEGRLPFLDILLYHMDDGTIQTSVYRKPMHADCYLDFRSNSPPSAKRNVVSTLYRRALEFCSTETYLHQELDHIAEVLHHHHYTVDFVAKTMERIRRPKAQVEEIIPEEVASKAASTSRPVRHRKPTERLQVTGTGGQHYDTSDGSKKACQAQYHPTIIKAIKPKSAQPKKCLWLACEHCCLIMQLADVKKQGQCGQHEWNEPLAIEYATKMQECLRLQYKSSSKAKANPICSIPYVRGLSEKIREILKKAGFQVYFKKGQSLRDILCHLKDPLLPQEKKGGVYVLPCSCGKCYIGQTSKLLSTRLRGHMGLIKHMDTHSKPGDKSSKLVEHCWECNCRPLKEEMKFIHMEKHTKKRELLETAYIKMNKDCFAQPTTEIPRIWSSLLQSAYNSNGKHKKRQG